MDSIYNHVFTTQNLLPETPLRSVEASLSNFSASVIDVLRRAAFKAARAREYLQGGSLGGFHGIFVGKNGWFYDVQKWVFPWGSSMGSWFLGCDFMWCWELKWDCWVFVHGIFGWTSSGIPLKLLGIVQEICSNRIWSDIFGHFLECNMSFWWL